MNFRGKSLTHVFVSALVISLIINLARLVIDWYEVSSFGYGGRELSFLALTCFGLLILSSIVGIIPTLLMLPFRKTRALGIRLLICCIVFFGITVAFGRYGPDPRLGAFRSLAERSRPLVSAIHSYTRDHGTPPSNLKELTPDYINELPTTGIPRYPEYRYTTEEGWDDNPWVLYVETSRGFANWDMFIYFPRQNYPHSGYGGLLKKVAEWAYVYE